MKMVYSTLDSEEARNLSEKSIAELMALENRPIDYSDDREMTREELRAGRLMAVEMRKKQMFSLRLQTSTIDWWKQHVGEGYTGVMARLLDKATKHPEWIKDCL
jgi:uncharacterized protein (DUF4415 family)